MSATSYRLTFAPLRNNINTFLEDLTNEHENHAP